MPQSGGKWRRHSSSSISNCKCRNPVPEYQWNSNCQRQKCYKFAVAVPGPMASRNPAKNSFYPWPLQVTIQEVLAPHKESANIIKLTAFNYN